MTSKPDSNTAKPGPLKPARKILKGATETSQLFVNVDEIIRRSQALRMTPRYIE